MGRWEGSERSAINDGANKDGKTIGTRSTSPALCTIPNPVHASTSYASVVFVGLFHLADVPVCFTLHASCFRHASGRAIVSLLSWSGHSPERPDGPFGRRLSSARTSFRTAAGVANKKHAAMHTTHDFCRKRELVVCSLAGRGFRGRPQLSFSCL